MLCGGHGLQVDVRGGEERVNPVFERRPDRLVATVNVLLASTGLIVQSN
jgi:hypothetical protein